MRAAIRIAVAAVVALCVAAYAGQLALLRWALDEAARASGGRLAVEGVSGGFGAGVRIGALRWRDSTSATLEGVRVGWNPWALARGELELTEVDVESLRVRVGPGTGAPALPASLRLPFALRVGALKVAELEVEGVADAPLRARAVEAAGGYRDGGWAVDALAASGDWGSAKARATLGAARPFALSASASAVLAWRSLAIDASADGDLSSFALRAKATGDGTLEAGATVRPFDAVAVERVDARLDGVGARWAGLAAPWRANVSGSASVRPLPAAGGAPAGWGATLDVRNADAGPVDAKAIPMTALAGEVELRGSALRARRVAATLAGGGRVDGTFALDLASRVGIAGATIPRVDADLRATAVDASRIAATLPATRVDGRVSWADGRFRVDATDAGRSGLSLAATGSLDAAKLAIDDASLGTGRSGTRLKLSGRVAAAAPNAADLALSFERFEPSAVPELLGRLREFPAIGARARSLADELRALRDVPGAVSGSARLAGPLRLDDPARPTAVSLRVERGTLGAMPVRLAATAKLSRSRVTDVSVDAAVERATLAASGALGAPGDRLVLAVSVPSLAPWAGALHVPGLAGAVRADVALEGAWAAPSVTARASGAGIVVPGRVSVRALDASATVPNLAAPGARLALEANARDVRAGERALDSIRARASGTAGAHDFTVDAEGASTSFHAAGRAALSSGPTWRATVSELALRGRVDAALREPAAIELGAGGVRAGPARVVSEFGELSLARLEWRAGRYDVDAELSLKRLATLATRLGASQAADLRDAGVDDASSTLAARAVLSGTGAQDVTGTLTLRVRGAREGTDGSADLALAAGRLSGTIDLQVPSLAVANRWIGPQWSIGGRARLAGRAGGTLAAPRLEGTVTGEGLRLEQRERGWRLGDGTLAARLDGDVLRVESLRLYEVGADGRRAAAGAGSIELAGEVDAGSRQANLRLVATRLAVPLGPGQRVVVSGDARVTGRGADVEVKGSLRADEGLVEIGAGDVPPLPPDVVIAGAPGNGRAAAAQEPVRIAADVTVDLGENLRVRGSGLDARLVGTVEVRGRLPDAPRVTGTVRVRGGRYFAYGRELRIRRGLVVFTGRLDNPTLDVVAVRGDQPVEAGVELSGTALSPRMRLTSTPEVPDSEKLSWLVLGAPLEDAQTAAQSTALAAAASTLMGNNDGSLTGGIANALGLDLLTLRSSTAGQDYLSTPVLGAGGGTSLPAIPGQVGGGPQAGASTSSAQNVVAVGKRLNSRVFVTYEQGLRGVWNLLQIQYQLTRQLSVRVLTGSESAVDVLYRFGSGR